MEHLREGSGEPLLLVHGVGHHAEGWRPVVDRLAGRFEVVATDSPGFGASPPLPPGRPPDIEAYVDAFARFLGEQGFERPHAAGNSMGGAIVLELARRGLVRSACAISPVGFWTAREAAYCRATLSLNHNMPAPARAAVRRLARVPAVRRALFWQVFAHADRMPADATVAMLDALWAASTMDEVLAALTRYRWRDDAGLDVPVTVAWGERDRLLLFGRQAPRARRRLPSAEHVVLEGLGHTPMWDDPDAVARVISATAARADAAAAAAPAGGAPA